MVIPRGSTLTDLPGVGPVVAAWILVDAGDVARFADRNRFASWTGTAPLEISSEGSRWSRLTVRTRSLSLRMPTTLSVWLSSGLRPHRAPW